PEITEQVDEYTRDHVAGAHQLADLRRGPRVHTTLHREVLLLQDLAQHAPLHDPQIAVLRQLGQQQLLEPDLQRLHVLAVRSVRTAVREREYRDARARVR